MRWRLPVEAIVFDLDGTLIDSVPEVQACLNRTLAEAGRRPISIEETRQMLGEGARTTIERAFAATGARAGSDEISDAVERYLRHYREHPADHTHPFPGVPEVLAELAWGEVKMGVCTNKPSETAGLVLKALGLAHYFEALVCGDQVPHPKPDGRHVRETLAAMNCADARAVMVGDSPHDLAAARAAGIPAIVVRYGYWPGPAHTLDDHVTIDSFAELPTVLNRFGTLGATS